MLMDKYFVCLAMRLARIVMLACAFNALEIEILYLKILASVDALLLEALMFWTILTDNISLNFLLRHAVVEENKNLFF
jgi:hypothetical protein